MKNRTEPTAPTPKELLNELRTLVGEAEKMLADSVTEHSADALTALKSRFTAAQERAADLYAAAKKKVVAGAKATDTTIREHPYQSIAAALGAGLLIGILVGRRTK